MADPQLLASGTLTYTNQSGVIMDKQQVFMNHGKPCSTPTNPVEVGDKGSFTFSQKSPSTFYGVSGLVGYTMGDGNTLAMMFSVPTKQTGLVNMWNVRVYEGYKSMDKDVWDKLYLSNDPIEGDITDSYHVKKIGCGYLVKGRMTACLQGDIDLTIMNVFFE